MAENLVEDVRLLQVVELLARADEGRRGKFALAQQLEKLAEYNVPVTRDLEDAEIKKTAVWQLRA